MINVTIRVREVDMQRHIAARLAERRRAVAIQAARMMVNEVESIISNEFHNDRPVHRRKAGSMKLINSFEGAIAEHPNTVDAILRPKAGADTAKIAALDKGWEPFTQDNDVGFSFPDPRIKGNNNVYGTNNFFTWGPVENRGREGAHFLRRAKRRVAQRLRSR